MFRTATLLFLTCLISGIQAQTLLESLAKSEMMRYRKLIYANKRSDPGPIDIQFASLNMEPNMTTGEIVSANAGFIFKVSAPIDNIEFDLRKELTVDSVIYHGQAIVFLHTNTHLLNISFPQQVNTNATDSLRIFYHGKPDMTTRAYTRDVTASGPSISTLSEPYGAHYWWPCRENLTDKVDSIDINLTVDTSFMAVSNGKLVLIDTNATKRTFHYKHRYPIATYLVAVSFARYNFYIQQAYLPSIGKTLDIRNHVFLKSDLQDAKNKTLETVPIIRLYDSLFGTYPFHKEHYGHAQFTWGGGMEHQTMSFMVNFSYDLIAHELAHQWFGDKITCGSWRDIWLNEGFATYSNLLCYNYLKTQAEWINMLKKNKADVMAEPGGSVYAKDTGSINALFDHRTTYQKGAMVLHQLRWVLGDSVFYKAIRNYLSDNGLAYGFAREANLRNYFEQASGLDLDDYFSDWIYGEGYPQYDVTWSQKGTELVFDIIQTQTHPSVKEFNVPLPLLVKGINRDTFLRVDITSAVMSYKLPWAYKVKEVIFDPDEWLLAKHSMRFTLLESANVTAFPNPFNGFIYLSLEDMDIKDWEIVDVSGQRLMSKDYGTPLSRGSIEKIDCNVLADGVYMIRINGSDRTIVKKIVKK